MSGPFGSSQWMYSSGGFYGFPIEQSLRFNDDDSAYLSRTPASAGNRRTWTWSGWVKRGNLGTIQLLFGSYLSNADSLFLYFVDDNLLVGSYAAANLQTNAVYRDVSAWYHIALSVDTTQATAADRLRLYVNGVEVTSFSMATYPSLNADLSVNATYNHTLSSGGGSPAYYFDGYLAEVNFIDGQALDPTSFGEFKSGVWIPKRYGGTYGTNGFRLSFADSGNIGDDTSGNTNDWTANSLVATDVLLDSPTNNFAVLNAIGGGISETLSEGNLSVTTPNAGNTTATIGVTSGKWYWEGRLRNDNYYSVGITNETGVAYSGSMSVSGSNSVGYWSGGGIYDQGGLVATVASYTTSDVVAAALDMDAGNIKFYKNNTLIYTYTFGSSGAGVTIPVGFPAVNSGGISGRATDLNFGQDSSFAGNKPAQGNTDDNGVGDFYYAPPSGYLALCTANLPDPVIDPAQDDVPADYFNTVLYTGNGGAQAITGVGFQPDMLWAKSRSNAYDHLLVDAVRGGGFGLASNSTAAETASGWVSSFNTDGFTYNVGGATPANALGATYAAWNWLAGNGTSSNTSGSITSTVSVNQKAGFSIVAYLGTGANATVGHGLGVAPSMVIVKKRNSGVVGNTHWNVYHSNLTSAAYTIYLSLTNGQDNQPTIWNSTPPTASVFSVGSSGAINENTYEHIAYCFAEVEGYSKFGSYTGNGSTDGPFVYTGFRPAWVMLKCSSSTESGNADWHMQDNTRNVYNLSGSSQRLFANLSNAEAVNSEYVLDFLSNGFKLRTSAANFGQNTSGQTYIYMAFAENPFKYANAR